MKNIKIQRTPSKRWSINLYDLLKGLITTVLASSLDLVYQALKMWLSDHKAIDWQEMGLLAILAGLGYLMKQFGTSNKQPAVGEPVNPLNQNSGGGPNMILLIGMLSLSLQSFAVKPTPKNDTIRIPEGSTRNGIDLLKNDIKGTNGAMIVTSLKYNGKYPLVNKELIIPGFGTITVTASGIASIKVLDGILGQFPAIGYVLNDGTAGNGTSASIVIIGIAQVPIDVRPILRDSMIACTFTYFRWRDSVIVEQGRNRFMGSVKKGRLMGSDFHYVIIVRPPERLGEGPHITWNWIDQGVYDMLKPQ